MGKTVLTAQEIFGNDEKKKKLKREKLERKIFNIIKGHNKDDISYVFCSFMKEFYL